MNDRFYVCFVIGIVCIIVICGIFIHYCRLKKKLFKENNEIKEENKLLKGLIDQVPVPVVLLDKQYIVKAVNAKFLEYYGKPSHEIIGKNIQRINTDFLYNNNPDKIMENIEKNVSVEFDINAYHINGETIPFHLHVQSYHLKYGEYVGVIGIDQKKIKEKNGIINQQQNKLREIQHLGHLGYWEIDYSTKNIYWSKELYSILGYEEGEIEPDLDTIYWMAYEDDQNRVWSSFLHAFQKQEKVDTQYRLKNNKGELLDIYLRIRHFFSKNNEHLGTVGILQDITKQVDLREELNAQLLLSDSVLNNSHLLYIGCDKEFQVLNVNNNMSKLIGISKELVKGKQFIELFGELNRTHQQFIQENMDFFKPLPLKDGAGCIHFIQWDYATYTKRDNEEISVLIGIDITETIEKRKALEERYILDPVTKLPNRYKLERVLDNYFNKNRNKTNKKLALIFIYINGTKDASDSCGQKIEDELMCLLSERLYRAIGKLGLVVRRFSNQFVLFYPCECEDEDIEKTCKLVNQLFVESFDLTDYDIYLSCNIGVAIFPKDTTNKNDLLRYGSAAMHEAQRLKKDYYFFDDKIKNKLNQKNKELRTTQL
jgi:diguanylate cyclase (GGDEF)-like protein/PAS domain S-box-containing protein